MMYRLDMTEQEKAQLTGLLDVATKAAGLQAAQVALALLQKISKLDEQE